MDSRAGVDEIPPERQLVTHGDFQLNRPARRLTLRGEKAMHVELTKGESDVLASLMSRPQMAMTCREIVRIAFRYESPEQEAQSVIRPYVSRLRSKFEEAGFYHQPIATVRGRGYMFADSSAECS
jgi:DNA-binding response OmpR family regulator